MSQPIPWQEALGYLASLLILISFVTSSIIRLRLINLGGSVIFGVYGFLIGSIPTGFLNLCIAGINIYYLIRLKSKQANYSIVEARPGDLYLERFLKFFQADISRHFPEFDFKLLQDQVSFYVLSDMTTIGLFVGTRKPGQSLLINLDYAIPGYQDMKVGRYVQTLLQQAPQFADVKTLYALPGSPQNQNYLAKMGFAKDQGDPSRFVKRLAE